MQTHLLLLTQRESRQEERECMCVYCEMQKLCTHHSINTQESLFKNGLSLAQANGLYKYGLYTYHNISVAFFKKK